MKQVKTSPLGISDQIKEIITSVAQLAQTLACVSSFHCTMYTKRCTLHTALHTEYCTLHNAMYTNTVPGLCLGVYLKVKDVWTSINKLVKQTLNIHIEYITETARELN